MRPCHRRRRCTHHGRGQLPGEDPGQVSRPVMPRWAHRVWRRSGEHRRESGRQRLPVADGRRRRSWHGRQARTGCWVVEQRGQRLGVHLQRLQRHVVERRRGRRHGGWRRSGGRVRQRVAVDWAEPRGRVRVVCGAHGRCSERIGGQHPAGRGRDEQRRRRARGGVCRRQQRGRAGGSVRVVSGSGAGDSSGSVEVATASSSLGDSDTLSLATGAVAAGEGGAVQVSAGGAEQGASTATGGSVEVSAGLSAGRLRGQLRPGRFARTPVRVRFEFVHPVLSSWFA